MQFDRDRDDRPCGGIDRQSTHFADRLTVGGNYRPAPKVFVRNLHRQTIFPAMIS
jgi:hypothetical protein